MPWRSSPQTHSPNCSTHHLVIVTCKNASLPITELFCKHAVGTFDLVLLRRNHSRTTPLCTWPLHSLCPCTGRCLRQRNCSIQSMPGPPPRAGNQPGVHFTTLCCFVKFVQSYFTYLCPILFGPSPQPATYPKNPPRQLMLHFKITGMLLATKP